MQRLGYDAGERVRRGAEIRAAAPPEPTGGIVDLLALHRLAHRARGRRRHRLRRRRRRRGQGARRGGRAGRAARGGRAARRGGLHRAPARHAPAPLPRRRPARDARAPADPAAARPRGRRHHARQLRHVLPHARRRARALARRVRVATWTSPPHFERVERELNVVPVPPELAGANAHVARRGAEALGWSGDFVRRNVRGCVGSGVCAYGCPANAKQHVGVTYVPKAHAAGATTYTGVTARTSVRPRGVECSTAGGGRLTRRRAARRRRRGRDPHARAARPQRARQPATSAATSRSTPPPPCGP